MNQVKTGDPRDYGIYNNTYDLNSVPKPQKIKKITRTIEKYDKDNNLIGKEIIIETEEIITVEDNYWLGGSTLTGRSDSSDFEEYCKENNLKLVPNEYTYTYHNTAGRGGFMSREYYSRTVN